LEAREEKKNAGGASLNGVNDAMLRANTAARRWALGSRQRERLDHDLLAASGQEPLDAVTNKVWCDGWQAGKRGAVKAAFSLEIRPSLTGLAGILERKGDKPLESVAKADSRRLSGTSWPAMAWPLAR
jgi:hypothetical protein